MKICMAVGIFYFPKAIWKLPFISYGFFPLTLCMVVTSIAGQKKVTLTTLFPRPSALTRTRGPWIGPSNSRQAGGPWTSPPNWRHASKIVLTVVSSGHYSVGLYNYSIMPEEDDDSYISSSSDEDDDMVNSPPNEVEVTLQAIDQLEIA